MHSFDNPIRIEAARLDNQAVEQRNSAILILKRRVRLLLGVLAVNIFISAMEPLFPEAEAVLEILLKISGILFLFFFVRAGLALAMIFITKTKDYVGGYIEVYNDHILIKQLACYANNNQWESAEIWFEDLLEMRNSTNKSIEKIYEYNYQLYPAKYIDEIWFEFRTSGRSRAETVIATKGNAFALHFKGYNKEEVLDLGRTIYSMALKYNSDLQYEEEPIIYKRVIRRIRGSSRH
ncbi:MAG: hypothetical protein BWY74_02659 [Firmicutes bacterium ADurb.Bin419]|nr:MAG: hypothetical protein BWY74_02659 [Firmicutes bacterium ADurb.Bin419]